MINLRNRYIRRATVGYAVFSALWILLSDPLLSAFTDVSSLTSLSMLKGLTFVLVTAALLYFILHNVPGEGSTTLSDAGPIASSPETVLAISETASRMPRAGFYIFAVAVTAAMLLLRAGIAVSFEERTLLTLFMFPIILSALLGGLGPGLVSTAVAAVGAAYFFIPPIHRFLIGAPHDQFQWGMLIANGVIVSILSEAMHRSLSREQAISRRLNAVVSGTSDAVFVKDLKGRYQLLNKSAAQFVGKTANEVIGHDDTFIFAPDAAARVMALDRAIMEGGRTQTHEESLPTADGKELTFLVTKGPVFNHQGNVAGLFGISRDITERKQADREKEEAVELLRQSETMYHSLFDNMLNGFAYCRMLFENDKPLDFIYLKVNQAFETLTGLRDVAGKRVTEVIPGIREADPKLFEIYGRVALTGQPERFEIFVGALQMWFWVSVYSPRREYFVAVFDVITERKKAEEEKAIYQRQLELLLETAGEGIFGVNREGNITFVNRAAIRMLGHAKDELIGRSSHAVFHSHRGDGADYPWRNCPLSKTLNDGLSRSEEKIYYKADGSGFPIEFTCTAIVEGGIINGAVMMFRDITERRKIESELRQSQKLEGIGQLAGGIAHDFNNVLNAVVGFAGLLQMQMDRSDSLVHYADEIMTAGQRGAALTQQILAFSRKQVLDMKPVNLHDIVKNLERMLHRLVREDIDIQYHLAPEDLVIFADISQIDQILINLVTNARDAMPEGGRLDIATEAFVMDREYIEMHGYGSPGEYAVMTIADTGCGMDADTRAHIFEPFFTTKESGKGTGLGLAVVHGIVKQHNGFINVYSEGGKGTSFRIYLPLSRHTLEETENKNAVQARGGTETILIAEDDAALRKLSQMVLSHYGYRVVEAVDGEDAVRKFAEHKDDIKLVILDGIMPNKNGKDAFDEIRKLSPDVKAIFMSGYSEDIFTRDGIPDRTAVFIQKPVTPTNLIRKVRETLDG